MNLVLPEMGEGVIEATVSQWLKKLGDTVEPMEPVVEVETDKVTTEVVAEAAGRITAILIEEGKTVEVGTILAEISSGDSVPEPTVQATTTAVIQNGNGKHQHPDQTATESQAADSATRQTAVGRVSPVVARMAAEHDLDLTQIVGTGLKGRITKRDVVAFLETSEFRRQASDETPLPRSKQSTDNVNSQRITASQPTNQQSTDNANSQRITAGKQTNKLTNQPTIQPLSPMRRAIADHMVHSVQTSPHATTIHEVDFSAVMAHRKANKQPFADKGVNLTFTAYIMLAVAEALGKYPLANSSWHVAEDGTVGIALHQEIHIGMATAVQNGAGLVVPVIKHGADYNLLGMARIVNELVNKARDNKLTAADMQGGTFTVTNHGVSGSLFATPIINQPQAGILGVGAIKKQVVVIEDEYGNDVTAIRPLAYLSCSFDHRILDGVSADGFVAAVRQKLELWQ